MHPCRLPVLMKPWARENPEFAGSDGALYRPRPRPRQQTPPSSRNAASVQASRCPFRNRPKQIQCSGMRRCQKGCHKDHSRTLWALSDCIGGTRLKGKGVGGAEAEVAWNGAGRHLTAFPEFGARISSNAIPATLRVRHFFPFQAESSPLGFWSRFGSNRTPPKSANCRAN